MKLAAVAFVTLTACGTQDPPVTFDPCNGQCTGDQYCDSQTGGVKDAGTFSSCASWPTTCGHDCSCLLATRGGCPTTTCGVADDGAHVLRCIGD